MVGADWDQLHFKHDTRLLSVLQLQTGCHLNTPAPSSSLLSHPNYLNIIVLLYYSTNTLCPTLYLMINFKLIIIKPSFINDKVDNSLSFNQGGQIIDNI